MSETLLRILGFLFRLLVLALTGEWPGGADDEVAKGPRPAARKPIAPVKRTASLDLASLAASQRASEDLARLLADVETAVSALAEPIVEHAKAQANELAPLRFLALADVPALQARDAALGTDFVPIVVNRQLASVPERWVLLARPVARGLFDALAGWSSEIARAHRLPPSLFVPPGHAVYDADTARAALGVWLPELFADAYATYVLGPAYASALAASLARPQQPMETSVARTQGRFLSEVPPSVVRMHVVSAVLQRLGQHDWDQTLRMRWQGQHGASDVLYLPLADGRLMGIPLAFMLGELDEVLVTLLDEPQAALGGETWLDVPGFAYLHAEHAQAQRVAASFARGEAVDAPARILLSAAALALDESLLARPAVAAAFARSLRGAGSLDAAPNAYTNLTHAQGTESLSLRAAFRDRAVVRDALLLGAVLSPLKRRQSRS